MFGSLNGFFVCERESEQMLQFILTLFLTVIRKESHEEEVQSQRWQIESLVNCVPRHLQILVAFPNTGKHTVEARDTTVPSATSHLGALLF